MKRKGEQAMKKRKQNAGWKRIVTGGAIGAGIAVLLCIVGAGLTAKEVLPENAMNVWCVASILLSSAAAAEVSADADRKLLFAVCGAGAFALLLAVWKLAAFPGGGSGILKNAGFCLGAGLAVGLLKGKQKKRKIYTAKRR